jgi:very-short-patch-repair endonuclease
MSKNLTTEEFINKAKLKHSNKYNFDFYLPKNNLLIEFDGQQHFNIINYWGGIDRFKKQEMINEIKNKFAKKNKINLLRIKYNEINNIENILNNKL